MVEDSHVKKFAAVYAEAVLTFLDSREPQWVTWDGRSHQFDFGSMEMDIPPIPVMLFVDDGWSKVLGDIGEIAEPESPDFDSDALRSAIEAQIADEGFGERLLKIFQERLARLDRGEEDDDDGDDEERKENDRDASDEDDA